MLRGIALGRKAWPSGGSDRDGERVIVIQPERYRQAQRRGSPVRLANVLATSPTIRTSRRTAAPELAHDKHPRPVDSCVTPPKCTGRRSLIAADALADCDIKTTPEPLLA